MKENLYPTVRIPALDGIRGLAILLVLFWHYFAHVVIFQFPLLLQTTPARLMASLSIITWSGVDLFFVLSGFLIGGIVIQNRSSKNLFSTFYIRRTCRIFPIYYLWVGIFYLVLHSKGAGDLQAIFNPSIPWWSYITYTQNWFMSGLQHYGASWLSVTWSLAVEEQFYLIFPLLVFLIPPKYLKWVCVFLFISAPVSRVLLFYSQNQSGFAGHLITPCRWDTLFLGVLLAILTKSDSFLKVALKKVKFIWLGFLLLGLGIMYMRFASPYSFFMQSAGLSLLALFYGCFVLLAVIQPSGYLNKLLSTQVLNFFGKISYGLYLTHIGILELVRIFYPYHLGLGMDVALISLISLTLSIGISYLSFVYFEQPILRFGQKFNYSSEAELSNIQKQSVKLK